MSDQKKLALYTSVAAIEAATKAFNVNSQSMQAEAHKLACSVLARLAKSNDVRLVSNFLKAMPEMTGTKSLMDWFVAYGPISFGDDNKTAVFVKGKPVELAKASADPFWKFSPPPVYQAIDLNKFFESAAKKLIKDGKETGRDHSKLISALNKIIPEVAASSVVTKPSAEAVAGKAKAKRIAKKHAAKAPVPVAA